MPLSVTAFESTPNPNAIKCMVSPPTGERVRSYFNPDQAAGDELARALFAIPGVTNVLIHTSFITVGKAPGSPWAPVKAHIKRVLREHG